ncbi:MAG: Adenylate cyclase, partial [Myxococcaceae bacterium]|nr:Adenylate cyclase [Myxococcaceae bacterium]
LYAKKLQQEALTRERFQRLLSPAIAEQVMNGKVEVAKGGQLRETTVLFSDIRGFTSMSESRDAQEIVDMLNEYFEQMVEIVFRYEGTLDKFVGDEIMALYGSPVKHDDDAVRAVRTALDMLEVLEQWNRERVGRGQVPVYIGIGINSGEVVAGYLGSSKALEYTVIGDSVNVGARLCSAAKPGQILVSEDTEKRLNGLFDLQEQPPIALKGKSKPLRIYSVIGEKGGRPLGLP